jgi:hypothetical protein
MKEMNWCLELNYLYEPFLSPQKEGRIYALFMFASSYSNVLLVAKDNK